MNQDRQDWPPQVPDTAPCKACGSTATAATWMVFGEDVTVGYGCRCEPGWVWTKIEYKGAASPLEVS